VANHEAPRTKSTPDMGSKYIGSINECDWMVTLRSLMNSSTTKVLPFPTKTLKLCIGTIGKFR